MNVVSALLVLVAVLALIPAAAGAEDRKALRCDIGPLEATYGRTPWLVYSCTDGETMVVVSDTGSPAMPFYFTFFLDGGGYRLTGEGTGDKAATAAAFEELGTLSAPDIKKLIAQTVRVDAQRRQGNDQPRPGGAVW